MALPVGVSLLLLLVALIFLVRWSAYLRLQYWTGERIRVVHSGSQLVNATLFPFGPGLEKEAVNKFCRENGIRAEWIRVSSRERALEMLKQDRADLVVGFHCAGLDSELSFARKGRTYLHSDLLVAHNRYRYPYNSDRDFCRARLLYLDRGFWRTEVARIQKGLDCRIKSAGPVRDNLALFSDLDRNKARFALTDRLSLNIWHPFFTSVRKSRTLDKEVGYAWIWGRRYTELDQKLQKFSGSYFGSLEFKRSKAKYLGFLPDKLDHYQINHFLGTLKNRVSGYKQEILEAAQQNNMDPLFFMALIYQESHFDPVARSRTGVRGLLQISRNTAQELGVNRLDPRESIVGGGRYMRYLWEQVGKRGVTGWDRWFMSLAAYNQGMSHLWDAMQLAREMGRDHLSWHGVKDVYPLLSYKKYYQRVPNGYCRGYEAVDYVQSIRFYYFILRGLVLLERPEIQDFARSAGDASGVWP
ncbi:MAG: transglycosylase SLT domain-containing protein [Desulfonatronovibrionaceae bacterium]